MVDAVLLEWEGVLADTGVARRESLLRALADEGVLLNAPAYDAVRDGETGLVRDNLPSEWAEAIVRLVKDRELRAALVERARETVRCERTIATAAERLSGILTQTLDEPALV